ncbi:MAG: NhaB family Na+:H+ antiporter [Paraglaciecola sp.]|jgi:NhaB family Na+:H+ antiporter
MSEAFNSFLGNSPNWYKKTILAFLILNPILLFTVGPTATGWIIIGEFILTLAMALKCYPLQSGGLIALEVVLLNLTTPKHVFSEIGANLEVILLLVFMVAGIYFMKPLLMFIFGKIFIKVRSKVVLSLLFCFISAFLSAFLDALTVTAVLIGVFVGFYQVYMSVHSSEKDFNHSGIPDRKELDTATLEKFRNFLRSLVMHGAVGTALGGVCTIVGEPQNLLIGEKLGWDFVEFFLAMAPITMPVLVAGLMTCVLLEVTGKFGFGEKLPTQARDIIQGFLENQDANRTDAEKYALVVQAAAAIILIAALALHLAPVGLIGLTIIVLQTAFTGITDEHSIGHAFEEALPFTALLAVFFVIVAMIHDLHLFKPIIQFVLEQDKSMQPALFYAANGILSMISDNVFVATVYINEVKTAFDAGIINRQELETLAIAINTGTNLPSVATPNGQAAFLFLLTSALAPAIRLSYMKMIWMALPYTIVLGGVGLLGVIYFL